MSEDVDRTDLLYDPSQAPRVFISYAHDSKEHKEQVRQLWLLLRRYGIDARLDQAETGERRDSLWASDQVRLADFVLVVASVSYRIAGIADSEGAGVQREAAIIRESVYNRDRNSTRQTFVAVTLPGHGTEGIPHFLSGAPVCKVTGFTLDGAEPLLRLLTGQPSSVRPSLGSLPKITPRPGRRVFLCHSSQDKDAVRELYWRLKRDGVDCWFDEEDLLPGQEWEQEINKALRICRYVLACLSTGSTSPGYVQKELKHALELADHQPEGAIFLIPVRLELCDVPDRLRHLQWVDLFKEGSYDRLLKSLKMPL